MVTSDRSSCGSWRLRLSNAHCSAGGRLVPSTRGGRPARRAERRGGGGGGAAGGGCGGDGVGAAEAEAVVAVVQGHSGKWRQVRQSPEDLESVAVCVFGQQRLGGGLHAAWDNGDLCLEYTWPRVI